MSTDLTKRPEWTALQQESMQLSGRHLRDIYREDPARATYMRLALEGLSLDFSHQKITARTLSLLLGLAKTCGVEDWRDRMFGGDAVNTSENRAALHTALRGATDPALTVNGRNVAQTVSESLRQIEDISQRIRTGRVFTDIVVIGIGGSNLGPRMVCEALAHLAPETPRLHFVSNIDATHMATTLADMEVDRTLFIIQSKTFTTAETLTNAHSALRWAQEKLGPENAAEHFLAITANTEAARAFGVPAHNILPMQDWTGGRFSLWSATGLPIAIAAGFESFRHLLDGARAMDLHFLHAPLDRNIPVILALCGIWNRNFMKCPALAVSPYIQALHAFPAYIQQLDMESNGKSVDRDGRRVDYETGPVVFGEVGADSQHAFFQLLHQGTDIIPCEFITVQHPAYTLPGHNEMLLANAQAQVTALMEGRDNTAQPFRHFPGNRPSLTIALESLSPFNLGMLLSLYEHKIFVQGTIWNINSFDQWGVELGKELARDILTGKK